MTTLEEIRQRVRQQMLGYTRDQQQMSLLMDAVGPIDTTLTLDSATARNISRGIVEIDDELILIKSLDASTSVVTVMGGAAGRGREGSVASSHAAGSLITMSPVMPRSSITFAINDTVRAMSPRLPIIATTEINKLAPVFEYVLPAEAVGVHYVTIQTVGPSRVWHPGPRYRFNNNANTTDFPSGKSVQLLDGVVPGRAMRVTYFKEPGVMTSASDNFAAVTGYPDSAQDVVVWGACARLVPSYETARLQGQTVEGNLRATINPPQAALRTAEYYRALYEDSLERERTRFFDEQPSFSFWQGG